MQIGIVGLPLSGKSTLFQTITKSHLDQSQLVKSESHHAVIKVPDDRLNKLAGIFNPQKVTNAAIEFWDVIGLQKGDSDSAQFTGNFLSTVKTNDALIQVVHLFENEMTPHPSGSIDMMRDINTFETEFILSDLAIIEKRIDGLKKQIQKIHDDHLKHELSLLEKCFNILQTEKPLRETEFLKEDLQILKNYQFLTLKPMLIALNMDESHINDTDNYLDKLIKTKTGKNTKAIAFFGEIEFEMSELDEADMKSFMNEYGIKESALTSIIREAYSLLGLQSFFTVGEDECRAWTIHKGMNAQDAAGVIHSDFFNKFIRAEVVHYDDFLKYGSFAQTKERGVWRLEGKEYLVIDGDILTIRHN